MPVPNPVAFTIFGFEIMWYGLLIATGIVTATIIVYRRAPFHGLPQEKVLDFVLISVPAGIIGARIYYVIFNWSQYNGDFLKMLNFRLGGLAVHGGLICGLGVPVLLCILWKFRPLNILDLAAPAVVLAQSIGRWGNYFNSEAHGSLTDLPWAVTIGAETYHPTFLYESIWCFALFWFLLFVDNRRQFEGQTFLLYGILYSVERFFVEILRTDSLMLGSFKQAQVISLVILISFAATYFIFYKRQKGNISSNKNSNISNKSNINSNGNKGFILKLKDKMNQFKTKLTAIYLAYRRKDTPRLAKIVAAITVGYALSPIDFIPDFIPVIGYLDDIIFLLILIPVCLKLIPENIMAECEAQAKDIWETGTPKKWLYAIPIIVFWILIISFIFYKIVS